MFAHTLDNLSHADAVANGVAVLDAHDPQWREHIDPVSLNIASHSDCILGQVFGDYSTGMSILFPETVPDSNSLWNFHDRVERSERHGFEAMYFTNPDESEDVDPDRDYEGLQEVWLSAIDE